jgi:peptidoglycan/LPS O-acetylase OafA/YrhL
MKKYVTPGLILILAGIYFLLDALPGITLPDGTFFILVGLGLLIGRLCTKRYGLTIAGFIVLCLGTGWAAMDLLKIGGQYTMAVTPLTLSLAFFLIHICEYRRVGNWPLIPALVLLVFSTLIFLILTPSINALLKPYYGTIFPILLIIIGVCLLVRGVSYASLPKRRRDAPQGRAQDPSTWAQPPLNAQPAPGANPPPAASAPAQPAEPIITADTPQEESAPKDGGDQSVQ